MNHVESGDIDSATSDNVAIDDVRMSMNDGDTEMSMATNDALDCNEPKHPLLVSNMSQAYLNIEEELADLAEIGDTDSAHSSQEMMCLTVGHNYATQCQLETLIKNEDYIEECASDQLDNWAWTRDQTMTHISLKYLRIGHHCSLKKIKGNLLSST